MWSKPEGPEECDRPLLYHNGRYTHLERSQKVERC